MRWMSTSWNTVPRPSSRRTRKIRSPTSRSVVSLLSRALDVQVDPYEQLTDQWLEARIDELLERVARIRAELARAQALVTDAERDPCKH